MNNLREIRKKKGLTQAELAWMVKEADPTVDQSTISVLERGDIYPGEKLLAALCIALEVPEEAIYSGIETAFIPADEIRHSDSTKVVGHIFKVWHDYGLTGRISREMMCGLYQQATGEAIKDRQMRKLIEKARQEGMVIGNDQDGRGYYLPETREELERIYHQNQSRALAILRQQKHIRRRLNGC